MTGLRFRNSTLALVVLLAACTSGAPEPDASAAEKASAPASITEQELETMTQALQTALRAGDGAAAGAYYADDAVFVSARGRLEGKQAISDLWTAATKNGTGKELTLVTEKWGSSGDLGYTFGHYTGGITAPKGHFLQVVERQSDGTLKMIRQISIPDAAVK